MLSFPHFFHFIVGKGICPTEARLRIDLVVILIHYQLQEKNHYFSKTFFTFSKRQHMYFYFLHKQVKIRV